MALIGTNCGDCGGVTVVSRDVTLVINEETGHATFAFHCSACGQLVCNEASERAVTLLEPIVETSRWVPPPEMAEIHEGPPISHDEVLEFHNRVWGRSGVVCG